jgi:hypothetical protein
LSCSSEIDETELDMYKKYFDIYTNKELLDALEMTRKSNKGDFILITKAEFEFGIFLVKIAKKFKGGGHFNAAGARIKDKKTILDFINKIIS